MQGRHEQLVERLQSAVDADGDGEAEADDNDNGGEAEGEAEGDGIEWLSSGHELLGARVARPFGKRCALGTISKWVDADEAEGDPALFRAEHDDGDEEDLEEEEVRAAVALYKEHPKAIAYEEKEAKKAAKAKGGGKAAQAEEEEEAAAASAMDLEGWRLEGHPLVGRRVVRCFGGDSEEAPEGLAVGARIKARYRATRGGARWKKWFKGRVTCVHGDGCFSVEYDDGDVEDRVLPEYVQLFEEPAELRGAEQDEEQIEDESRTLGRIVRWLPVEGGEAALFHV
eukprot:6985880-Prymnesium_polylepis.1